MTDREKVIKGLETCIKYIDQDCPIDCPYYEACTKYEARVVFQPVLRDALALLKEQEPTRPVFNGRFWWCSECGQRYKDILVVKEYKFCPWCGREIIWDKS